MRENNGFALLYNFCLLVWTARLFPLVERTKWCQTVTIGDDDSHRARALRKLVFRSLVAWKKAVCGSLETSFWLYQRSSCVYALCPSLPGNTFLLTWKYYSFQLMYKQVSQESKHLICSLAIKDYCIKKDNH